MSMAAAEISIPHGNMFVSRTGVRWAKLSCGLAARHTLNPVSVDNHGSVLALFLVLADSEATESQGQKRGRMGSGFPGAS